MSTTPSPRYVRYGSGLINVTEYLPQYHHGAHVEFLEDDIFRVIIHLPGETNNMKDKLGEKLYEKLGENRQKILNLIKNKSTITITELASEIGISKTAIENNLKVLKQKGLLRRVGGDKGGKWEVIKPL